MLPRPKTVGLTAFIGLVMAAGPAPAKDSPRDALWAAVRNGDAAAVRAALEAGADVNARSEIGVTALWIAASKGKLEVIDLLLDRGADVNARDGIWYQTPLSMSLGGFGGFGNAEAVKRFLKAGAKDLDAAAQTAAARGNVALLQLVLDTGKVTQEALDVTLYGTPESRKEVREVLTKAGARPLPPADPKDRERWAALAGTYENDNASAMTVKVADVGLVAGNTVYRPAGPDRFAAVGNPDAGLAFERAGDKVTRVVLRRFTAESYYYPARPVAKATAKQTASGGQVTAGLDWPQFRGPYATGVADGQHPPTTWDVKSGTNVRWKTPIPGMGHSCPVVWGDRVVLTTAISSADPDPKVRTGNYGDVASVNDVSQHTWQVLCLDRETGKMLWTRTAYEGVPKIKRHLKGSQANCTPATDGKRVVACFGSEGLYCYDFEGKLLWKRDLSTIDSSFAIDREYEWGFGSSPVIHDGLAVLQFDLSRDSFIAAYSLEDGSRVWATPRDEIPSWSTPTVWKNSKRTEIVTNAAQYARGYDPATGKELWRLAKKSEVTIPTPVPDGDRVFVVSGNRPIQPIFALKPGASGDISLKEGQTKNEFVAWGTMRGGPYMPTPIVYGPHLYVCSNAGVVTCYEAATGMQVYRERIGGLSYTASPVAADGRVYFVSEQGEVRVVRAGATFELLAVNDMGDVCMACPAISRGALFVRTQHALVALGGKSSAR
ncbi:MAG TPA: PQQ-binding-like beta-propeller repeat protein [Gemmataceae bacterium]|nr:PQQ-binding-like beta-propeller repeat protein [Gemmataceae bacterium]